jgi:hypothetical protein
MLNNDDGEKHVDLNKLIERVKAILTAPKTTWPVIAEEPATIGDIYKNYVVVLAAIAALLTLVAYSMVGIHVPFLGAVRLGFGSAIVEAVKGFVIALAMVYVLALIVNAFAPTFGGQKNMTQAVKVVAYSVTAGWLAYVGYLIPPLAMLILLAGGVYSIYLLYLGLPHTMKCPPERAGGYTAVTVVVCIVGAIVLGFVLAPLSMRSGMFASSPHVTPDVTFDKDSKLGKLEEYGRKMEEASKHLEAAQKTGDKDAEAAALQNMMGTALGGDGKPAIAPDRLKSFVPETLGDLRRASFSSERNQALGMETSMTRATYQDESGRSVNLEITDAGTAKGLFALAGWAEVESESESDTGFERTYRSDDRLIHEQWDKQSSQGEYTVVVGERFSVKVDGSAESFDALKAFVDDIDLGALEALKDEGA